MAVPSFLCSELPRERLHVYLHVLTLRDWLLWFGVSQNIHTIFFRIQFSLETSIKVQSPIMGFGPLECPNKGCACTWQRGGGNETTWWFDWCLNAFLRPRGVLYLNAQVEGSKYKYARTKKSWDEGDRGKMCKGGPAGNRPHRKDRHKDRKY